MVAVYQKNQILAFAEQSAADTTKLLTIPLPPLDANQAIKITHLTWSLDVSGSAIWAAANCYLLANLSDPVRQIDVFSVSSQMGAVAAGGSRTINGTQQWDDQDGFFTVQDHLILSLYTGLTGVANIMECLINFDIVAITETNYNQLLLGKPAVRIG